MTDAATPEQARASALELTVVMPCLNEADTLATCIDKAQRALESQGIAGEVVVADTGSTDGSQSIAQAHGARVVPVAERGYGNALMGGIAAAQGRYIIMGDADDSYDFGEIPKFVAQLRKGHDVVQGCRLPAGGGTVKPGAMPLLHYWIGNPLFSFMIRWMFASPIHDVYCGLRGFTREAYARLNQRCTGMEFAIEMIVKASLLRMKMAEVPITLHPDGRKSHPPHLRTFRDGWRTLRFLLMYSPRWLFLVPGCLLLVLGLIGYLVAMPGTTVAGVTFDVHTLLVASLSVLLGYQALQFAVFTKMFAITEGLLPPDRRMERFFRPGNLERGLILGLLLGIGGLVLLAIAVNAWRLRDFGRLDYAETMRWVVPGVTLTAIGFQTVLASFFVGILGLRRR